MAKIEFSDLVVGDDIEIKSKGPGSEGGRFRTIVMKLEPVSGSVIVKDAFGFEIRIPMSVVTRFHGAKLLISALVSWREKRAALVRRRRRS